MSELGKNLEDISKWFWMTVFLFWLLFPPIVLLVKYLNLIGNLKAAGAEKEGNKLQTIVILSIIPLGITQLIAFFMNFGLWKDLRQWAASKGNVAASEGFGKIRTGDILNLIPLGITQLIAFFMIPGGFKKAGIALQ